MKLIPVLIGGIAVIGGIAYGLLTFRVAETNETGVAEEMPYVDVTVIPGEHLVLVSDTAFTPSDLMITLGETVVFVNVGTEEHWPASDIHPSHEVYPEFDPQRSLAPGERWTFTFTKPGLWRMHDHDNAVVVGSITVVDPNATSAPKVISAGEGSDTGASPVSCSPGSTDFYCFENYYKHLVATQGVPTAMADLRKAYTENSFIQAQCHPLTHVIGRAATLLYPKVSEAYSHGDSLCWSGYYHGVMEGIIGTIGRSNIVAQIDTICADIPSRATYGFDYYNCVHGLGHGLMAITNNELFESLTLCDNLTGSWERESCYGGVFMENVIVDNKNHFTKYLKPEEPIYPCNAVEVQHKHSCYLMQTSYMLKVRGNDFAQIFPLCRVVDAGYEAICFQSLGRDASGMTSSDAPRTKATCDMGANTFEQSNCIIGAVKDFISYYHSDVEAKAFCAMYTGELQSTCLSTAASYYTSF